MRARSLGQVRDVSRWAAKSALLPFCTKPIWPKLLFVPATLPLQSAGQHLLVNLATMQQQAPQQPQQRQQAQQPQQPLPPRPAAAGVFVDAITERHVASHPRHLLQRRCMQHTRERGWM